MASGTPRYVATLSGGNRSIVDQLEVDWTALCDEGPCSWLTYRPAWIGAFLDAHEPNGRFHTISVRLDGKLRGLLLLVEKRIGVGPFSVRRMSLGANFYAWEFDLIHGEGDRDQVIEAILTCLDGWKGWDVLDAAAALDTGATPQLINRLAEHGGHQLPPVRMVGYIIPCPPAGSTFEEAVAFSAMTRKRQLKRHLKKIQTLGTPVWSILEPDTPIADQLRAFDEFLILEASGWKGRSGDTIQDDARMTATYRQLIQQRLIFQHRLEIDGVLVAANVGIKFGDRFLSERFSFNEDFAEVSPGHLMTLFTLCDMANRGCKDMDCAGTHVGQPTYKTSWTDTSYPISAYVIFRKGVRGRVLHFIWTTGLPKLRSFKTSVGHLRRNGFRPKRTDDGSVSESVAELNQGT